MFHKTSKDFRDPGDYQDLPLALKRFWTLSVVLASLGFAVAQFFRQVRHFVEYPFGQPIYISSSLFMDFYCYRTRFHFFHTAAFFQQPKEQLFNYPAPVALIYNAFYRLPSHALGAFLYLSLVGLIFGCGAFLVALTRHRIHPLVAFLFVLTTLAVSYPVALTLFLANMEIMVWLVLTPGICLYSMGYKRVGSMLFGVAGALKIYPLILLGVSISNRRFKDVALGLGTAVGVFLLCTKLVGPTMPIALQGLTHGLHLFQARYVEHYLPMEASIDHSLLELVKRALIQSGRANLIASAGPFYLAVVGAIGIALYFFRIRRMPELNQLIALSVASVLLPPVSHDYTLIQLYAPWSLLVLSIAEQRVANNVTQWTLACFAIAFAYDNFLIYHGVKYAAYAHMFALVGILGLASTWSFETVPNRLRGAEASSLPILL